MDKEFLSSIEKFHEAAMEWGAPLFCQGYEAYDCEIRPENRLLRFAEEDCGFGYVEHYVYKQISGWDEEYIRKLLRSAQQCGMNLLYDCREVSLSSQGVAIGCFTDPMVGQYYLKMTTNADGLFDAIHVFIYFNMEDYTGELTSDLCLMDSHPRYEMRRTFGFSKLRQYFSIR